MATRVRPKRFFASDDIRVIQNNPFVIECETFFDGEDLRSGEGTVNFFDFDAPPRKRRRTVYVFIDEQDLPSLLKAVRTAAIQARKETLKQ